MDATTLLRIAIAFVIAGTWISLSTLAGERLGSRLGGLIANLPSNILVSLLFIALTKGNDYATGAAGSVPVGMAIDTLFILAFSAGLGRSLAFGLICGLSAWAVSAALALALPPLSLSGGIAFYVGICILSFVLADRVLGIRAVPKKPLAFKPSTLLIRALFAGTIVAGAVALAQVAPPYLTGILATFPAVLLSTLVILSRGQGRDFARATAKILILSSSNIIVYALAVAQLFPLIGPWWGSLAAFAAAAFFVSFFLPFIRKIK